MNGFILTLVAQLPPQLVSPPAGGFIPLLRMPAALTQRTPAAAVPPCRSACLRPAVSALNGWRANAAPALRRRRLLPAPPPRPHVAVRVPPPSRGSAPAARSDAAPMPPSPRLLRRGRTHRPPAPPPQPHLPMHSGMRTCPRRVLGCSAAARCSRNAFPGVWRWQDCALMHSQRDLGQEKRRFVARYARHVSKMSWFWQDMRAMYPKSPANRRWRIHRAQILPRRLSFPVRDPQIMHSA